MRKYFLVLFICISFVANSQFGIGTTFKTGFDRVGFYLDQTLNIRVKNHQFDLGLRYYGPDYVFEKDVIGLSLGYLLLIDAKNDNFYFGPGFTANLFKERKSANDLLLSNFIIYNQLGYKIGEKWAVFFAPGIGFVLGESKSLNTGKSTTWSYFNYDFHLGIKYSLGR